MTDPGSMGGTSKENGIPDQKFEGTGIPLLAVMPDVIRYPLREVWGQLFANIFWMDVDR